jgi:putative transposase
MQITQKIALKPNNKQRTHFKKACGVARFSWNWGVAAWQAQYQRSLQDPTFPKPNGLGLKKEFNALKKTEFPWTYEVTKYASQQPFIYLQRAYQEFFKGNRKPPKFKKKDSCRDSFYVGGDQVVIKGKQVKVPNLGWVRLRESLKYGGKINGMTISRHADRWFVAFSIELELTCLPCKNQASVGVDLGINRLATLSTGETINNIRPLQNKLWQIKRYQRQLSKKKQRGSCNYKKQKMKLAKLHKHVADQRSNALHQLTRHLTKNFSTIVLEDLNVSGMLKNHKLARPISDVGFYEFRRQLEYKASWYHNQLILADPWFPSSKLCSNCQHRKEHLSLSDREFKCDACGYQADRDVNAAINLRNLTRVHTASSAGIHALGQDGSVRITC